MLGPVIGVLESQPVDAGLSAAKTGDSRFRFFLLLCECLGREYAGSDLVPPKVQPGLPVGGVDRVGNCAPVSELDVDVYADANDRRPDDGPILQKGPPPLPPLSSLVRFLK